MAITYLVTQATGYQARWTITHLLAAGAKVHAAVRDPNKVPSLLQHPDITIFKADSTDFEAILNAAKGCKGVFLNTYPIPGLEVQQARTIVDACKKAGVETVVATTTFCTGDKTMWDDEETQKVGLHGYFSSKAEVESIVRAAGFEAYTILRPGFIHIDYMIPNVYGNFPELPENRELAHAYDDGVKMLQTDASDVGKYAAAALQDPAKFDGQEIQMGKEYLTIEEARDILIRVSGKDVQVRKLTAAGIEEHKVFGRRFHLWANVKDLSKAAEAAKAAEIKFGISFTPLEDALRREKNRLLECLNFSGK